MSHPKLPRFGTGQRPFTAQEFAYESMSIPVGRCFTVSEGGLQALLNRVFELEQAALLAGHKIEVKVDGEEVTEEEPIDVAANEFA